MFRVFVLSLLFCFSMVTGLQASSCCEDEPVYRTAPNMIVGGSLGGGAYSKLLIKGKTAIDMSDKGGHFFLISVFSIDEEMTCMIIMAVNPSDEARSVIYGIKTNGKTWTKSRTVIQNVDARMPVSLTTTLIGRERYYSVFAVSPNGKNIIVNYFHNDNDFEESVESMK